VAQLEESSGCIRLRDDAGEFLLVFALRGGVEVDLTEHPEAKLPKPLVWAPVFSSNDERFGGAQGQAPILDGARLSFPAAAAVLLEAARPR
jgi:hypothetical protein